MSLFLLALTTSVSAQTSYAPTGLSAAPGAGQVALTWTPSAGGFPPEMPPLPGESYSISYSYSVYRGTSAGGEGSTPVSTVLAPGGTGSVTYTDNGLTGGTTYYYQVAAVTTVTGQPHPITSSSASAPSNEASATANLAAPTDLAVYATGSGKVTLYWSGVPGATGYNVYRGTAAGGEGYSAPVNGGTPVATMDTGPGVSNLYLYSDTGLTNGTEYFYTVEAANGSGQSGPSNEDSDAPDPTAIPWDSGIPATITSLIRQNESDQTGLNYSLGYCSLRVMGPDGVIYQEGSSSALPPDGSIDPVNGTMTIGNEVDPAGHFILEANSNPSQGTSSTQNSAIYAGAIRRVTSRLTGPDNKPFTAVSGTVYLPSTANSDEMFISSSPPTGKREGPHAYIGMTSDGVEADAGVIFHPAGYPAPQGSSLPNRWEAFLRISDGPYNDYQPNIGTNRFRAVGDYDPHSYIYADSLIGNDADMKFTINRHDRACGLIVQTSDDGGLYFTRWYVAASKNVKPLTHSLLHLQMKREVSIDQNIVSNNGQVPPGLSYVSFSNAIAALIIHSDGTRETKTTPGYVPTGSYMNDIGWQNGSLYDGSVEFPWATSLLSENYYSAGPGSTSPVSLSPPSGDPQNETVSIHH